MLFPEDKKMVKMLSAIVVKQLHAGMKVFSTSMVATCLLQHLRGIQWGKIDGRLCAYCAKLVYAQNNY